MALSNELSSSSSSLSLLASSLLWDNASSNNIHSPNSLEEWMPNNPSVSRLSSDLEKLFPGGEYDRYHDAEIEVEGISIGVDRGILAVRSPFFNNLFSNTNDKKKHLLSEIVPHGRIGYEVFVIVLNYLYTEKMKETPIDVSTCVDDSCIHEACGPAIDHSVQLMYASFTFQIPELVMIVQPRLFGFVGKAFVEDVIPILKMSFYCQQKPLLEQCVMKIARSDLDIIELKKGLPHEIWLNVQSEIALRHSPNHKQAETVRSIRKIHEALDKEDLELVNLLSAESNISLDSSFALHHAAEHCSSRMIIELLKQKNSDVNLRNPRGHTVLHVAARRKDPSILIPLLDYKASVFDTTGDGLTSASICRRLTRVKDFNEGTIQCRNKDRICIDILESKMRANPCVENVSILAMIAANDLYMMLQYFESRVALAHSLFPSEAKLAMKAAESDTNSECLGGFDEIALTTEQVKRQRQRLLVMQNTVKNGRRYFPNCYEVVDKCFEDEFLGFSLLYLGSPEDMEAQKARYKEISADVAEALHKDKRCFKATRKKQRRC